MKAVAFFGAADAAQSPNAIPDNRRRMRPSMTNQRQIVAPVAATGMAAFDIGSSSDMLQEQKSELKPVTRVRQKFPESWIWMDTKTVGYCAYTEIQFGMGRGWGLVALRLLVMPCSLMDAQKVTVLPLCQYLCCQPYISFGK